MGVIIMDEIISNKQKEDKIKGLRDKMDKLIDLASIGGESINVVHNKIEKIQQEINEIQLSEFMSTKITERMRISECLPFVYNRFSTEEKKSICQEMIEKIYLSSDGDIEIVWKI